MLSLGNVLLCLLNTLPKKVVEMLAKECPQQSLCRYICKLVKVYIHKYIYALQTGISLMYVTVVVHMV